MRIIVLSDSQYGNTTKLAHAIAGGFDSDTVRVLEVDKAQLSDIDGADLLIVGSPTQGGRPKAALQSFLDTIPPNGLQGIRVAAFDTAFLAKDLNFALKLLIQTFGYAAPKIAATLESKGGKLVIKPQGFYVKATEGPLKEGELERAQQWAQGISRRLN